MSEPVAIVGAGWYGCYAADYLSARGVPFVLVDQKGTVFGGASAANQNRLHIGFHYPRSAATRRECAEGYRRFARQFPDFLRDLNTFYFVAKQSIVDYSTYTAIFKQEGVPFREVDLAEAESVCGMRLVSGYLDANACVRCDEKWIDPAAAKQFYAAKYGSRVLTHIPTGTCGVLDCTYGQANAPSDATYEVCIALIYRQTTHTAPFALTVMDGEFFSIHPYQLDSDTNKLLYTVTHVTHTPVAETSCAKDAKRVAGAFGAEDVEPLKKKMLDDLTRFVPDFESHFEYVGYLASVKCKFRDAGSADRSMRVWHPRTDVMSFCGGKITGIFGMDTHLDAFCRDRNKCLL